MTENALIKRIFLTLLSLLFVLCFTGLAQAESDYHCTEQSGYDGVRCGVDSSGNGQIDDCSEMLPCSRVSFGNCVKLDSPYTYKCIYSPTNQVDCTLAKLDPCPTCKETGGVVSPFYKYRCTQNSQVYDTLPMCQSECGGACMCPSGGLYNASTGKCEVISALQCPDGYYYNPTIHVCVKEVECPPGVLFDPSGNKCSGVVVMLCPAEFTHNPATGKCEKAPDCPAGGTFNPATGKCETEPNISCPTGYTYNPATGKCELDPQCPPGGTFNPTTGRCEAQPSVNCPTGYTYNPATQKCEAIPQCPPGGTYNPATDNCQATPGISCPDGYTYNPDTAKCEVAPGCPPGGTYNATNNRCEALSNPQCPSGYTYNPATEKCEANPICSQGTYNPARDKCELSVTPTCSSPYTVGQTSPTNYICQTNPICSTGTYNPARDKCEIAGTANCPTGYSWNSTTGRCESNPQCPSPGSYNPSTNRCETGTTVNCPTGYTYNQSTGKCEANPSCPSPGNYNPTRDRCEVSASPTCPTGTTWNAATQRCEANPTCAITGFTYDATANLCTRSATVSCPAGYTYNSSLQRCIANPQCPAGGSYHAGNNRCEAVLSPNWYCSLNGQTYPTQAICLNACRQTANCTASGGGTIFTSEIGGTGVQTQGGYIRAFSGGSYGSWVSLTAGGGVSGAGSHYISIFMGYIQYRYNDEYGEWVPISGSGISTVRCMGIQVNSGQIRVLYQSYSVYYGCTWPITYGEWIPLFSASAFSCPLGNYPCTGNPPTCTVTGTCTQNYTCPAGYTQSGSICIANASCPAGGWLNTTTDVCEATPSNNCPSGSTWNPSANRCEAPAVCPTGTTLNGTTDKCEALASYNCPSGYTWDSTNQVCRANAICPTGGTLNPTTDKCEVNPTFNCPTGYTLSGNVCVAQAICPAGGTFNPATNKCETNATFNCPTGYTYNPATQKCEANPVCPTGSILNPTTGMCEAEGVPFCPVGTTYNPATGKCESQPMCSTPGVYNPIVGKCTADGTPNCPAEYTYNPVIDKCEMTPPCTPSDWVCPVDANNPLCNNTAPIMNRRYLEVNKQTNTFATTKSAVSMSGFENIASSYGASPASIQFRDFITQQYGVGPFWIQDGVLYHDVYFNTKSCYSVQDFSGRNWRPRDHRTQGCAKFPKEWEKIETACLCTRYEQKIYTRTCSPNPPYYTETLSQTLYIDSNMSTCSGTPLFCSAGLSQQGLNECNLNVETKEGTMTCGSVQVEQVRKESKCINSIPSVEVPTEYRIVPDELFGILHWNSLQCTPCLYASGNIIDDDVPSGPDVPKDEAKICTNFKMFSGSDRRCRPSSLLTIFSNCCNISGWFKSWCNKEERELKKKRQAKICHEVGTYCAKKIKFLGICLQRKKTYCCFSSQISRLINEQGRPQIGKGWGSPRNPDCKGFTPEEFQLLDFSSIDLSEWIEEIEGKANTNTTEINKGLQNWLQKQKNPSY